jgi:hypothetical protein
MRADDCTAADSMAPRPPSARPRAWVHLQHRASANIASITATLAWRARIIVGGSHLGWSLAACGIETVSQRETSADVNAYLREITRTRRHCKGLPQLGHTVSAALALQEFETFETRSGQDECTHSDRARGCAARQHAADMPPVSAASTPRCAAVRSGWPGSIFAHEPVGRAGSSVKTSSREGTQDPAWAFASRENSNAQHEA